MHEAIGLARLRTALGAVLVAAVAVVLTGGAGTVAGVVLVLAGVVKLTGCARCAVPRPVTFDDSLPWYR